jgi:hypothetical protein
MRMFIIATYRNEASNIWFHADKEPFYMGFEVFMAMSIQTVVFWVVALCNIVDSCQCFSKMKATSYENMHCHNPEDHNLNSYSINSTTDMKVSNIRNILQVICKRLNKTCIYEMF